LEEQTDTHPGATNMDAKTLRNELQKAIKNATAGGTVSPDKLAKMELVTEYFTNPTFKAALEAHVYQIVK
jgi:hypothetical protein